MVLFKVAEIQIYVKRKPAFTYFNTGLDCAMLKSLASELVGNVNRCKAIPSSLS